MKNKILLLAFTLITITVKAQFISIEFPGINTDISGSYSLVGASASDHDIEQRFWIYNETANPIDLSCRRVEIDVASHTDNATCWRVCPPPMGSGTQVDWTSTYIQTIQPGEADKTFSAHLYPENVSGCSHFRYYFFIDGQPSMIDSVDVYFEHGASCNAVASIDKITSNNLNPKVNIYPNPSIGELTLDMELPQGIDYSMKVVNVVGQNVIDQTTVTSGVQTMDWTSLNPGMYFVILSDGEKAVMTKKIQITR